VPANPVARLERGERPRAERREQRVLAREEIGRLLDGALPGYRPILATAVLTGLRLGELLGLVWGEIDFDAGLVRVRKQLDRDGLRVAPKTPQAVRDVVLMPALASLLREHRADLRERQPAPIDRERDFVFATLTGTPMGYRNVERRGLDRAADNVGLKPAGCRSCASTTSGTPSRAS
jgi:integrase